LPPDAAQRRYFEPFAGAASLFFALAPRRAVLADLNACLVQCYRFVRSAPDHVASHLRRLAALNSKLQYYRIRESHNRSSPSPAQAARFIYLNATCFNGVFRVNRRGSFNVPFGDKPRPNFPTKAQLIAAARLLKRASLRVADYEAALRDAQAGDLVYLDPPYPPLNGTSYFTHYTPDRFGMAEQQRLANIFRTLDIRGCYLLMTNADLPVIRRLYSRYHLTEATVPRYVSCKNSRHRVAELVITNYAPPPKHRQ
jgi:DNA adenine methylase